MGMKHRLTVIALIGLSVAGFQNCSPVDFDMSDPSVGKAGAEVTTVDQFVDDDTTNITDDDPTTPTNTPPPTTSDDPNDPNEPVVNVAAVCQDAELKAQATGAPQTLTTLSGHVKFIYLQHADAVSGVHGKIVIVGAPGATIGTISGLHRAIICGVTVGTMNDGGGRLDFMDGHIDTVNVFKGSFRLYNSTVDSLTGNRGNVKLSNSTIGI